MKRIFFVMLCLASTGLRAAEAPTITVSKSDKIGDRCGQAGWGRRRPGRQDAAKHLAMSGYFTVASAA